MKTKKDFFLPTKSNKHEPILLQKLSLLLILLLVLLTFAFTNIQALLWQSSDWLVGSVLPSVVVNLTNERRSEGNISTLIRNPVLDRAAKLKAEDMANRNYFAHHSPDGLSPWHWFGEVDYSFAHAGENLAVHFSDSEAVVEAWMASPTHKANIINQNYTEIGVATAKGSLAGQPTVFVVQMFGTPAKETLADVVLATPEPQKLMINDQVILEKPKEIAPIVAMAEKGQPEVETIKPDESFLATSSGLEAKTQENQVSIVKGEETEVLATLATKPTSLLQIIYLVLGSFVIIILLLSIFLSLKKHSLRQVVYGTLLLLVMSGLFYVHLTLTNSVALANL